MSGNPSPVPSLYYTEEADTINGKDFRTGCSIRWCCVLYSSIIENRGTYSNVILTMAQKHSRNGKNESDLLLSSGDGKGTFDYIKHKGRSSRTEHKRQNLRHLGLKEMYGMGGPRYMLQSRAAHLRKWLRCRSSRWQDLGSAKYASFGTLGVRLDSFRGERVAFKNCLITKKSVFYLAIYFQKMADVLIQVTF